MFQPRVVCSTLGRVHVFTVILSFALTGTALAQCVDYGGCPACYSDAPPKPTDNGTVYIAIDASWNDPNTGQPNSVISQALNDAINNWNSVNSVSCSTGYTLASTTDTAGAGVLIVQFEVQGACADAALKSLQNSPRAGQDQIELRSSVANDEASAARLISHELGHILGLNNVPDGAFCNGYDSIMELQAPLNTCVSTLHGVTAADGSQVNRNDTNRGTCTSLVYPNTYPKPGVDPTSCPSNNSCPATDSSGNTVFQPDFCQYDGGCPSGWLLGGDGVPSDCCGFGSSPIIIDVAGDGFELTDAKDGVMFDLTNSGKKQRFSWTAAGVQNGWLALDRDGDGTINSGAELFGNVTPQPSSLQPNGYLALAVYDLPENGGNGNGEIDPGDQIYGSLLIWIDVNHNGISEPSELHHLADLGIEAIGLEYQLSNWTDQYGNIFRYKGRIKIANKPGDHWAYDVLLRAAH